jgi:hypothetical protein
VPWAAPSRRSWDTQKGDLGLSMTSRYAGRETMEAKAACVRGGAAPGLALITKRFEILLNARFEAALQQGLSASGSVVRWLLGGLLPPPSLRAGWHS